MKKISNVDLSKKLQKFFLKECDIEATLFECNNFYLDVICKDTCYFYEEYKKIYNIKKLDEDDKDILTNLIDQYYRSK